MIEFVRTANGLYFRFDLTSETLVLIVILVRFGQRFL